MPCIAPTSPKPQPAAVGDKPAVLKPPRVFALPRCFVVNGINNDFIVGKEFSCAGYFNEVDQGGDAGIIGGNEDMQFFVVPV